MLNVFVFWETSTSSQVLNCYGVILLECYFPSQDPVTTGDHMWCSWVTTSYRRSLDTVFVFSFNNTPTDLLKILTDLLNQSTILVITLLQFALFLHGFDFFFYLGFLSRTFTINRQENGEAISLTPFYHFHELHRHLDISSRTQTENLWFPSASR